MDIVIIGSGNVASALGRKMMAAGHRIVMVIARNEQAGKHLANILDARYSADMGIAEQDANVYLAAVPDDVLPVLSRQLKLNKAVLVHTAGAVSMDVLKYAGNNYGVMYPLQTFRAEMEEVPDFPLLVDGNTADTLTLIRDLAETLSTNVVRADDSYRRRIHLAAVFSGNFTNHLFAFVQDYCRENNLDFSLLLPHIRQVVDNLGSGHAADRQTGPAVRNDVETLKRHEDMLDSFPEMKAIYGAMTASIRKYHKIKDPHERT
jgi:predicted short-subunit dehydrogenase-like oxidoreductase (DUF2520 family)